VSAVNPLPPNLLAGKGTILQVPQPRPAEFAWTPAPEWAASTYGLPTWEPKRVLVLKRSYGPPERPAGIGFRFQRGNGSNDPYRIFDFNPGVSGHFHRRAPGPDGRGMFHTAGV
jgi:hypothetical protein